MNGRQQEGAISEMDGKTEPRTVEAGEARSILENCVVVVVVIYFGFNLVCLGVLMM